MPLSLQQKKLVVDVDNKTKSILKNGGNEEKLLVEMLEFMPGIKVSRYARDAFRPP